MNKKSIPCIVYMYIAATSQWQLKCSAVVLYPPQLSCRVFLTCTWNCMEFNCPTFFFFLLRSFCRNLTDIRVWGAHYQTPLKMKAVGTCCHGLNPYNVWVRLLSTLNYSALYLQALLSACCSVKAATPKHESRTCKQSLGDLDCSGLFFFFFFCVDLENLSSYKSS